MLSSYRDVLHDDQSLSIFLSSMAKFDRQFCDCMASGVEFTLRLEIHGHKGNLIHCRTYADAFDRPRGNEDGKAPRHRT